MEESKLQLLARSLAEKILMAREPDRGALIEVLTEVTWMIGRNLSKEQEPDPVFWFDKKGRFCTRAKTREEIEDSMVLMAIAEGVSIDVICQDDSEFFDRAAKWDAFQEMKCKYLEGLMRIQELEEELQAVKRKEPTPVNRGRFVDVDHLKKLILLAMDISGMDKLPKDVLIACLDKAPSWAVDINTETVGKEKTE